MKIKKLKINSFGKLENTEIEFSDNINIISGKNESGKSTLLKFIISMFYGISKNKNGKTIPDFDKYKPWEKEEYSGKLNYTLDDGNEYEIYREFKKKTPIIYDQAKNDITKQYSMDKSKESLFFFEQTGITEENFLASCVSEQENLRLSNTMKNSIIQRLSNIVSTGNESTSYKKAIDKINKEQLEKIGNNRSAGRPINIIENEIEEKEAKRKEISTYENQKYEMATQKENLQIDLEESKTVLEILRKQKVNLEKNQLEKEKIKILKENILKDENKVKELEEKIKDLEESKQEAFKSSKFKYLSIILIVITITTLSIYLKKYIALALNIIPILIFGVMLNKKQKIKQQIKRNNRKRYQEKNLIIEEIEKIKEEYNKQKEEILEKEEKIKIQEKSVEQEIKQEFIEKLEEEIIEDILSTKYENIVEYIGEKEKELTDYKITEKTIEVDNQNILKQLDYLVEIDEKLESLYEKKEELTQLNEMYEMVKTEIEKAYQEMKENITPDFLEELKNILRHVTKEKYSNIYLDSENNLQIEIENGKYMPIERLSTGTIDLIYLALRLSATKEISEEKMPIIMDESFSYYDNERMQEILKYLANQENRQILIFTCSERECEILEKEKIDYNKIAL
ncbi:MAG: AAA family ATPase [Clostridia bacterium]|jgi:uncharacterized protein YhaN|nr:AAA family ATPase [Clostridia bacterium]